MILVPGTTSYPFNVEVILRSDSLASCFYVSLLGPLPLVSIILFMFLLSYFAGPTMVQLVTSSPNPPSIHMVQTGLGPVNNIGTGSIPLHTAPLPPTTMHMQPPMQDPEGVPPAVYNTRTGTVPPHMYPPMYHQPPPGSSGVYPHLVGFPSTAMQSHMHPPGTQMPGLGGGVVHHHQSPPHGHVQRYPPGAGPPSHASSNHLSNMDHSNRHGKLTHLCFCFLIACRRW